MPKNRYPITPAVRFLRSRKIAFKPFVYTYAQHGGTCQAAEACGFFEHCVIKTLVLETHEHQALLMLMHGDRQVSTRSLARFVGAKRLQPVSADRATAVTGYLVGGISPFGTRRQLPVFVQESILSLEHVLINGGKRGFLVEINPRAIVNTLSAVAVNAAV
ncbi:MAG: Cys-tRNA(Pro) deacylase [Proteobacteria bacterium]|nr:MAG: Cys-tRNA(Pro) deacylase [Pseudomonadota bacterium]PIE67222.1 MAG: Cys-tRNA(Pro) deacylase [Deltaproteobacteria bacterium]